MAATMHAKLNRRKLDKLNLIHICEEILNLSIPMALRLSEILMGGVVIVYERKVKLLYDDVTRLLVEINEAWKVKAARDQRDRTLLPKSKTQAKKEAVTLPEVWEEDVGGIEQSLNDLSNANATMGFGFHRSAYFAMQLDDVDGSYFNIDPHEEIVGEHLHQAHPENITLDECFDSCQVNRDVYNHFERFDIEGDEGTQPNFSSREHVEISTTVINSPPSEEVQRVGISTCSPEEKLGCVPSSPSISNLLQKQQICLVRKMRREVGLCALIPFNIKSATEAAARTSPPMPLEPSISSPERHQYREAMGFNFEDFHGGREASDSLGVSIENLRTNVANDEIPVDIPMGELRANFRNHHELNVTGANFSTPANDGHGIPPEVNLGRSNKKRHLFIIQTQWQ